MKEENETKFIYRPLTAFAVVKNDSSECKFGKSNVRKSDEFENSPRH